MRRRSIAWLAVMLLAASGAEVFAAGAEGPTSPGSAMEGQGAIVPDGYWANDPARELEVRDLPGNWCVRIFDTSGSAVRFYRNPVEGTTWLWNFRNDNGELVAPALYLVRVTDPSGTVQRSGRFLVQSGR
jgi:hypothetical protein